MDPNKVNRFLETITNYKIKFSQKGAITKQPTGNRHLTTISFKIKEKLLKKQGN